VAARKKKPRQGSDPLEAYRRIRKPMPPPERVIPDKRRKTKERAIRRDLDPEILDEES
jgi:hypothetical protein